jgi:hypothetical protein
MPKSEHVHMATSNYARRRQRTTLRYIIRLLEDVSTLRIALQDYKGERCGGKGACKVPSKSEALEDENQICDKEGANSPHNKQGANLFASHFAMAVNQGLYNQKLIGSQKLNPKTKFIYDAFIISLQDHLDLQNWAQYEEAGRVEMQIERRNARKIAVR